jgi:hypothetical protein
MLDRKIRSRWGPLDLIALALLVFVAGCTTTKDVTVAGQVVTSFGAMNQGAFELDDGTGRLWVWSGGFGVPSQGAHVAVTGRVQSGAAIGGRFFANVLRETQPRKTA